MYRTIIKFKNETPPDVLEQLKQIIFAVYDNRVGRLEPKQIDGHTFICECEWKDYNVLQLGWLTAEDNPLFMRYIKK